MTHNFCESCNRVRSPAPARSTCASARRTPPTCARRCARRRQRALSRAIDEAIGRKPKGHDFVIDRRTKQACRVAPHERDRRLIGT
jgi:cyclic pyranopterin phosphate synthase